MSKFRIKEIVVISQGKKAQKQPIGIVTLKDIIKFLIADKTDRDLDEIPISEIMNKHLIMAKKDTAITKCAKILTSNNVSSVIIVDDNNNNNNLAGIITSSDFANFFSENCIGVASVNDYMSHSLFTVSIKDRVSTAAQIMSAKKSQGLLSLTQIIKIH